ncbi:MAG: hypothetical protein K2I22_04265 [Lachnospiraceae bacterium]|nr:hypothetical protein [Lachnospiraceae bacterium]
MEGQGNSVLVWLQRYWLYLCIVIVVFILGILIGWKCHKAKEKKLLREWIENLENWIMLASFLVAAICMVNAMLGIAAQIESQYLSLYSSFIFAWILTKKTAGKDFKRNQHKIAKSTYRHIEDAETAVLIAKNRLMDQRENGLETADVEGLIDDLQIILTCIRSNKKDWRDMLKKKYRQKIDKEENPEDILARDYYSETKSKQVSEEKMKSTFEEEIKMAQQGR